MWTRKIRVYELEDVGEVIQDFWWEEMMVMCWGGGEVFNIFVDSKKTPVVKSCIGGERVHVFVVVYVE